MPLTLTLIQLIIHTVAPEAIGFVEYPSLYTLYTIYTHLRESMACEQEMHRLTSHTIYSQFQFLCSLESLELFRRDLIAAPEIQVLQTRTARRDKSDSGTSDR